MTGKTMTKFEADSMLQLDVVAFYFYNASQTYRA